MQTAEYVHLTPEQALPETRLRGPFRAVIILEAETSAAWRDAVSKWLVDARCLYAMTWGQSSTEWDTAIDLANIAEFDYNEIPEDQFVMTTWHDSEPLHETMWYAKNNAYHPTVELASTLLVHVAASPAEERLLNAFAEA